MRAAILTGLNEPLELASIEVPEKLSFGQVRVRVHYSGICGSQIGEIEGVKGPDRWLPHLLGHEGGGVVLEVGEGVTTVAPGDRVVLHWMRGEGHEAPTPSYSWDRGIVNAGSVTTFNEEAVVSENRVTTIPPDFPLDLAALLGCAVTTGAGVVVNDARLRLGESVLVIGSGGVGLSAIQAAALSGANPIIAVDVEAAKLELAERLGATHLVHSRGGDLAEAVELAIGDGAVDVVIETTGAPALIEAAYALGGAQGRTILVGVPKAGERASLYTLPLHFGKVLTGSHGGGTRPAYDIPRYVRLHDSGRLDLGALITDRFELEQINEAVGALRSGRVTGRAVITVAAES